MIQLWKPMMRADTGKPVVGIAIWKIQLEGAIVQVQFSLKRKKNGTLVFPNVYEISKSKLVGYSESVINGIRIMEIPLADFKEVVVH